jgi:glutathione S-transferase
VKLYDSIGPNPRLVRIVLLEKGIEVPTEQVDLMGGENRKAAHLARNPAGQMPCLELDDGSFVSEITAIAEYLEELHPTPALIGTTPSERAETRMWTRRLDLNVIEPMVAGFRYAEGLPIFKDRMRTIPEAADGLKALAQDHLAKVDAHLADNEWICGDRYSLADVLLYAFLDFAAGVGQPRDPAHTALGAWFDRANARPSAEASLHPAAAVGGMRA